MSEHYDAIIIGSGQGGSPLSTALADAGWKTALIERKHVGGTCINRGCTPTKTMVASARAAYLARHTTDYGVHTGPVSVDMEAVRARKQTIVERFRSSSRNRIEGKGVELLFGEARFTGHKQLQVTLNDGGTREVSADTIVINTGGRPRRPAGVETVPALDSTSIMELDTVPEHLIVVGGGYVGLEFSQMFRRFGSAVTILDRGARFMRREDEEIGDALLEIFREDGIEVLLEAEAQEFEQTPDGGVHVVVQLPDGTREIAGSHLLLAIGRVPNTDRLNLPATDVEVDERGFIPVNERLETSVDGVYALGDVKGGPMFTHISYDDFRVLRTNLLDDGNATIEGRFVPYTLFTDPQLGRVGLTEEQARQQGYAVRVATIPMNYVARAIEVGETRGLMKAIVDAETDQILGCAVLGIEGGELMAMLQIAMMGNVPYTTLRDGIFAHPTLAESLNTLFASLGAEE